MNIVLLLLVTTLFGGTSLPNFVNSSDQTPDPNMPRNGSRRPTGNTNPAESRVIYSFI
jgi:hypothetical protein